MSFWKELIYMHQVYHDSNSEKARPWALWLWRPWANMAMTEKNEWLGLRRKRTAYTHDSKEQTGCVPDEKYQKRSLPPRETWKIVRQEPGYHELNICVCVCVCVCVRACAHVYWDIIQLERGITPDVLQHGHILKTYSKWNHPSTKRQTVYDSTYLKYVGWGSQIQRDRK
jgi:hypothetical protein